MAQNLGNSRGQAIVLDNPRDPLAIYQANQQRKSNDEYRKQQLRLKNQQQQDNQLGKLVQYKYQDAPDLFKEWGQNAINEANAKTFEILQSNPNADPIALRQQLSGPRGEADKKLSRAIEVANIYKEVASQEKTPGIDPIRYRENLAKLLKSNPDEIDRDLLENFASLPMNFDVDGLVGESVKDIKDQFNVDSTGQPTNTMFGQIMKIENNKKRFTDIDKTLDYVLGGDDVSDIGKIQNARGSQIVDGVLAEMAAENIGNRDDLRGIHEEYRRLNSLFDTPPRTPEERMRREQLNDQVRERVRPMLEQLDQTARGVKIQRLGTFPKEGSKTISQDDYIDRDQVIRNIMTPFDTMGGKNPESRKAAARLTGGKLGNQNVLSVDFQRGGRALDQKGLEIVQGMLTKPPTAETYRELDKHYTRTLPSDKAVVNIKVGTLYGDLSEKPIQLDLSDPGSEAIINGILTTNPNEKKILYPDLLQYKSTGKGQQYLDSDEEEFLDD